MCSGVFTAFYSLLLERRVKHPVCRLYLLVTTALAALIPAVKIPVWPSEPVYLHTQVTAGDISVATVAETSLSISPQMICRIVWIAGTLFMAAVMVYQLINICRLRRSGTIARFGEYNLIKVNNKNIASFSFFGTVFVSADTDPDDLHIIIAHEMGHIRHRHSAERIVMELLKALLWWNPFVWIASRRLTEVQEYEADSEVLLSGCDIEWYVNTILKNLFGYSPEIANGLRDSLTKKRLKMMTNRNKSRYVLLRMAAVVPVVAGLMTAFSFTAKAAVVEGVEGRDNSPLYIVEGVAVTSGELNNIAPESIARVEVLKNEASAAQYAHLGDVSNGVVVISLKSGDGEAALLAAETMPAFNGGDLATFRQWVMMRVRYPEEALNKCTYGRVVASFVVGVDGAVRDIEVLQSPDELLSNEVRRVLSASPAWIPAENDGKPVSMRLTLPVDFAAQTTDGAVYRNESETPQAANGIDKVMVVGFGSMSKAEFSAAALK